MHTHSASPAGSMLSMKRIGRPPPVASYTAFLRASRNGATPDGQPDVEDVGVRPVVRRAARSPGPDVRPSAGRVRTVDDAAERPHQLDDVVAQLAPSIVVYCTRQVRPACRTGPPSVSSRPWSRASRTSRC